MSTGRRDIIAQALADELRRLAGSHPVTEHDAPALAQAVEAALSREEASPQPGEGRRPEELNSANDG